MNKADVLNDALNVFSNEMENSLPDFSEDEIISMVYEQIVSDYKSALMSAHAKYLGDLQIVEAFVAGKTA